MVNKQIILRKDVASNKMYPKQEMIRIVKNNEGQIFIDLSKKANGRGAYLKPDPQAVEKIKKTRALERCLKVKITPEIYDLILKEINDNWD
ncbi:putative RNA-binding protein [Spiroplasma clarkii]|uniref:YlxR domain-containing protein n=1 Tax=Spiroplasma clarkii TaxID=2139 RepID=A0A1Y0L1S4_9MOLU|nr:YlxR family protein [Spiroplasma clarkii]ARU91936.1 putative RNA-binding protein [Spiroplasma clarkii]ATX71278.1 hypothetical protein SCLAR_v1c09760 [Spiroplasma clarkii]